MGRGHIVGLESHRAPLQEAWSEAAAVCSCSFLPAWPLDLQDTGDLDTEKEYPKEASKSPLDVRDMW